MLYFLYVLAICLVTFSCDSIRTMSFRASTISITCLAILAVLVGAEWTNGTEEICISSNKSWETEQAMRKMGYTVLMVQAIVNFCVCLSVVVSKGKDVKQETKKKFTLDTLLGILGVLLWGLAHSTFYKIYYLNYTDTNHIWTLTTITKAIAASSIASAVVGIACMLCERKDKQRSSESKRSLVLLLGLGTFVLLTWTGCKAFQTMVRVRI